MHPNAHVWLLLKYADDQLQPLVHDGCGRRTPIGERQHSHAHADRRQLVSLVSGVGSADLGNKNKVYWYSKDSFVFTLFN